MSAVAQSRGTEPALVNPNLRITESNPGAINGLLRSHPTSVSYSDISSRSRYEYLKWLASPREVLPKNESLGMLYLWGLERRAYDLLVSQDCPKPLELAELDAELTRLMSITTEPYDERFQDFAVEASDWLKAVLEATRSDFSVEALTRVAKFKSEDFVKISAASLRAGAGASKGVQLFWWALACDDRFLQKFQNESPKGRALLSQTLFSHPVKTINLPTVTLDESSLFHPSSPTFGKVEDRRVIRGPYLNAANLRSEAFSVFRQCVTELLDEFKGEPLTLTMRESIPASPPTRVSPLSRVLHDEKDNDDDPFGGSEPDEPVIQALSATLAQNVGSVQVDKPQPSFAGIAHAPNTPPIPSVSAPDSATVRPPPELAALRVWGASPAASTLLRILSTRRVWAMFEVQSLALWCISLNSTPQAPAALVSEVCALCEECAGLKLIEGDTRLLIPTELGGTLNV